MNLQTTLKQAPLEPEDLPVMKEWLTQETVYKNLYILYHPQDTTDLNQWYKKEKESGGHLFSFRDGNQLCGIGIIHYIHQKNRCGEISIIINPSLSGKGYGQNVFISIINFSFRILNLNKLFFHTTSFNDAMIYIAEKNNLKQEGIFRQELFYDGTYHDIFRYGILAQEWYKSK